MARKCTFSPCGMYCCVECTCYLHVAISTVIFLESYDCQKSTLFCLPIDIFPPCTIDDSYLSPVCRTDGPPGRPASPADLAREDCAFLSRRLSPPAWPGPLSVAVPRGLERPGAKVLLPVLACALVWKSPRGSGCSQEGRPWQGEGHSSSFGCPYPHNALPALSSADYSPANLMWAGRPAAKIRPLSRKRGVVFTPRSQKSMISIR